MPAYQLSPFAIPAAATAAVVILFASLMLVISAEVVRRVVERRYGAEYTGRGIA